MLIIQPSAYLASYTLLRDPQERLKSNKLLNRTISCQLVGDLFSSYPCMSRDPIQPKFNVIWHCFTNWDIAQAAWRAFRAAWRSEQILTYFSGLPVFHDNQRVMYIHAHMHTYIHSFIHTYIHTCMHTYIHSFIHTCIHTYIHACMHTYIHTYINTQQNLESFQGFNSYYNNTVFSVGVSAGRQQMYELNVGIIEHNIELNNWFKIFMLWQCIANDGDSVVHVMCEKPCFALIQHKGQNYISVCFQTGGGKVSGA
jgi:hypothetical protein